ncbi:MAG: HlyD family efflux transporter periplasmic adaptor subunit [Tepidisphaeraceae bacterium]|jgi:putative peptide zinc metalloprotease protein
MLQLRPTFSESWYRVAELRPRLRSGAQISRQFFRGERWYVVRDLAGNQFHRLSDAAYRFVGLLDGRRTVSEAWELVGGQLADDAPTQPEVIQILSQLYSANLLATDITPDATVLLRRHKQMVQRQMQNRLMNVLFPRIPIWDPDRFLRRWMPVTKVLFSKLGAAIWIVVMIAALATILPQWHDLQTATAHALDMQHNWENLFYLYAVFVAIKFCHEWGHAASCRRFGGECHELGIMLLVLVPTPYVDASTAWAFPSKWQRIFVGSAGMIVELFIAAICAFIWHFTNPQTDPLISQLAYNAMFIASVSTLIFNANPLLRYDGYYILSDLLEIPNLRQKSTEYATGLIKRHVFRLKLQQPLPSVGQRAWLLTYAIASSIYRVFIGFVIVLLVIYKVPVLGVLMGLGGLITWLVVPVVRLGRYLLIDQELHRKRGRAFAFCGTVLAAIVIVIGLIKFPVHVDFAGVVQPDDPSDASGRIISGDLKTGMEGRLVSVNAHDGQLVQSGEVIAQLANPEVDHDIQWCQSKIDESNALIRLAQATDQNALIKAQAELAAWQSRLDDAMQKNAALQIKAPFSGRLVAPKLDDVIGTYLARGTEIGSVAVLDKLIVKGDIEQKDGELVKQVSGVKAEIRLSGSIEQNLPGTDVTVYPAAVTELAHPALGQLGGGEILVDPRDPNGIRSTTPQFEALVKLDNVGERICAGQRAYVRLTLDRKPLIWQWWRRALQLIAVNDTGKWL